MANRIEELYGELAEFAAELTQQGRIGREYEDAEKERLVEGLYKNDPAVLGGFATAATIPVTGPAWLANFAGRAASQIPGLNKLYGAVGSDMVKQGIKNKQPVFKFSKKIDDYIRRQKNADEKLMFEKMGIRNRIKNDPPLSGVGVGADLAGRYTLPTAKTAVQTARNPRVPINIEHSKQLNLPLSGARNTGGLDETGKAMLPYIQESLKRKTLPSLTNTGRRTRPTNTGIMSKEREALQKLEEKIVRDDSMRNVGEPSMRMKDRKQMEDEINRLRKFLFDK